MLESTLHQYLCQLHPSSQHKYAKMFGTIRCLRFYPTRLAPLGCSRKFAVVNRFSTGCKFHNQEAKAKPSITIAEQLEKLKSNPYYSKYSEKLTTLQQKDPKQFRALVAKLAGQVDEKEAAQSSTSQEVASNVEEVAKSYGTSKTKIDLENPQKKHGLDSIVKLDLLRYLGAEDIKKLWIQYYSDKDAVCAVIPSKNYTMVKSICTAFPVFIYPVPRDDGYEMFVGQFENDTFHFTSLHNYQKLQEFAPDQLTVTHYTELQEEKDIVLMSAMVDGKDCVSMMDAQMLCYLVQHYCVNHPNLMREFNRDPKNFSHDRIIDALDVSDLLKKHTPVD